MLSEAPMVGHTHTTRSHSLSKLSQVKQTLYALRPDTSLVQDT